MVRRYSRYCWSTVGVSFERSWLRWRWDGALGDGGVGACCLLLFLRGEWGWSLEV
jgi:hypothetical protein